MRFLSQMHEIGTEDGVLQAVIQAAAVWFDLDARVFLRDLRGHFLLEVWLPGAEIDQDPKDLDCAQLVSSGQVARLSSIADLDQLGWRHAQGEIVLFPIGSASDVGRIIVVPGPVDGEAESTIALICRTAAAALDELAARQAGDLTARLVQAITKASDSVASVAEALVGEMAQAVRAPRGLIAVHRLAATAARLVATVGDIPAPAVPFDVDEGQPVSNAERLAATLGLGGGSVGLIDLRAAPERPFGVAQAEIVKAGSSVVRAWLAGVAAAISATPVTQRPEVGTAPAFERRMDQELERARRLRLSGGVVVVGLRSGDPMAGGRTRGMLIQAIRSELRSGDLLGQLTTGDLAALIVRADAGGVAVAASRLRARLDALAAQHRLAGFTLGHAPYPPAEGETPAALLARARLGVRNTS